MKIKPALLWHRIRLAPARWGAINLLAIVVCAQGLVTWSWTIPALRSQWQQQQRAIAETRKSLQSMNDTAEKPARTLAEERLEQFYDSLGEHRYAEQQIKTLFAIAGKNNLILNQAEYKPAYDKNGKFHTYQIHLPVKGSYSAIRQFSEQTLLAIPFASLDTMDFKRDAVGNAGLEAKLRFTLYLADEPVLPSVALQQKERHRE